MKKVNLRPPRRRFDKKPTLNEGMKNISGNKVEKFTHAATSSETKEKGGRKMKAQP